MMNYEGRNRTMRKLIIAILILSMLPIVAFADVDVTAMTDQELKDLISACSAELLTRIETEPEGTLLFNEGGMRAYQTGEAYIDNQGLLRVPVTICNDLDERAAIMPKDETCNGWDIMSNGGAETKAKSKKKGEFTFWVNKADVTDISQIVSLSYRWTVFSMESVKTVYEQEEPEEHRFW